MSLPKIAFIGLGTMGFPMAGHLSRAGYPVTVFNRTTRKADDWLDSYQGQKASTPSEAADGADMIFLCVGNDQDVEAVLTGPDGALQQARTGVIIVDHTTTSANLARSLSAYCREKSTHFIDAPVSGGEQGAINGALTVMCGGDEEAFEQASPVMSAYARAVNRMGPSGCGQLTKMVNQICIAGLIQGLAEGLYFAEQAGLDRQAVVDVISQGAAQSWQMDNRHKTMIAGEYDHGFAVDWMRKDLEICLEEARQNGSPLPITEQVNRYYQDIQAMGGGRWDTSSLYKRLQVLARQKKL